ncbi:universal stress protein [Salinimicrobium oceani]|uniref:Universal stress protein n=1 Tax=Salinimicrobium oceani TaxID=2722702 RepID=A0ABX1D3N7_9FLAO|nr:universal stress protein [Salinimicrobium oceani]NJW53303.1 universal stress protein [Salinimicrobium oceani]
MKKIIYATDFSENSVAALQSAAGLAKTLGDDLIALHVYTTGSNGVKNAGILKQHQKELIDFCQEHLGEKYDPHMISPAAISGNGVAEEILKFSKDLNVRMVIMGACGASKLKDRILGTTTGEMIGRSSIPVLAVPPVFEFKHPQKILFSSTYDDQDVIFLKELIPLAKLLKAKIEVLHISHKQETEALENLDKFKEKVCEQISFEDISYRMLYSSEVFETLKEAIGKERPDIVLMPDRKNSNFLKRGLTRDMIKKMQYCSPSPLLSFPAMP